MKKNDQIAAAMVLRGMAKDGQFALKNDHDAHQGTVKNAVESAKAAKAAAAAAADGGDKAIGDVVKVTAANKAATGGDEKSVNGIANGIKGIVDAAEKAGEKLTADAAAGEANENNTDAGKLFVKKADDGGGEGKDAGKAAAAVAAVSGEQILKAIVDAAKDGAKKAGVADVKDATNPIEAAIGGTEDDAAAAAFNNEGMKKDDQIAAAMVLRGMAKGGQFALKNNADDAHKGTVKNAVESATNKTVTALTDAAG
ncbi:variable large family protein [Borreliella yangtzensis]|uniref:Variable large protein n=1 Tax=Borreliella yangtzensis TaxID=683292 RepID=A0ABR6PAR3_9SPIR|nr:hypothetical protein [Borreliella yangtzensis]MBB6043360.1 hypothetical protein [Borreliella yangtzensis]